MTDQVPVEPTTTDVVPPQQTHVTPQPPPEDYKARFDGATRKIQELTLQNRDLQAQLDAKSSEYEQLNGQLATKDVERKVAEGEITKRLEEALKTINTQQAELTELRALKLKMEVANEIGSPQLLKIIDRIPSLTDKEVLTEVMRDFDNFAKEQVTERERQLKAGLTPALGGSPPTDTSPQSEQAWMEKVESYPLGSKERADTIEKYGDWLEKQQH